MCLSRGTKRKLTQRTLLELNFCPDSKAQIRTCYSKELGNDLFHAAHDDSHVQRVVHGLSDISAVEESADDVCGSSLNLMDDMQNQVGMCGNPILKDRINANVDDLSWALKNEVPDVEMTVTLDDISGVILETFIVGRKFCDGNELDLGARISLLRDPDNPKDPNAIKVHLFSCDFLFEDLMFCVFFIYILINCCLDLILLSSNFHALHGPFRLGYFFRFRMPQSAWFSPSQASSIFVSSDGEVLPKL